MRLSRLIDANALEFTEYLGWDEPIIKKSKVQRAPTVDPFRHAHWEICCDGYYHYPYCSECKQEPPSGKMTDWCPLCGCRMNEGEAKK